MNPLVKRTPGQLATRGAIETLQQSMMVKVASGEMEKTIHDARTQEGNDQVDHFHAQGVYGRGLLIPKDTAVVGHLHKQSRICVVTSGTCTFTDEFHSETVTGPWVGEFRGGTKTAVYAHTDTYWIAFLGTDITDPNEAVESLTATSHADYEKYVEEIMRGTR